MSRQVVAPVVIAERYQIVARIGAGGMGEVFRASDLNLRRTVAVKLLPADLAARPGFVQRFRAEAQAAARLSHPNAVQVYDSGSSDGSYYMVMEYIRGRSLREVLASRGQLEPAQAAAVTVQVLAALAAAHGSGLVHCDIKPENILVTPGGDIKVADFGIARMAEHLPTQEGVAGTAGYVSPEQIRGEAVDGRSDVYSAGCVLYELLCGAPPFEGSVAHVLHQHLHARVPAPSLCCAGAAPLDRVVTRATEPGLAGRYPSAAAMLAQLQEAAQDLAGAPPLSELSSEVTSQLSPDLHHTLVAPPGRAPGRPAGRHHRAMGVATLLVLILAAGALFARPVPQVSGLSQAAALARLHRAGFKAVLRPAFSDTVPQGTVISWAAPLGFLAIKGSGLPVAVSKGPDVRQVPPVVGRMQADAVQAIAAAGLVPVELAPAYSSDPAFPAGTVLAQSPGAQAVRPGTPVNLTISRGAQLVSLQSVLGMAFPAAQSKLVQLGLTVARQNAFSDVPAGLVVDQNPKPPVTLPAGSQVTVVVSQGAKPFPMPKVVGATCAAARSQLQAAGLVVAVTSRSGQCAANRVLLQDPLDLIPVAKGATATLYVP